jgi:DNA-binding transcriptional ArsR family regulator
VADNLPLRDITDPRVLRAMAHPLRLKLVNALALHGPATATELADRVGDTPANCSWHLRQLAKFEFIEEAADLPAKGRNRPWRWIARGTTWGKPDDPPELVAVGQQLTQAMLGYELTERQAWDGRRAEEKPEWISAAFAVQTISWLTAEELEAVGEQVREVLFQFNDRLDPAKRPEGSRPVRFIAWGNPSS